MLFDRDDWAEATRTALENHVFVQPFTEIHDCVEDGGRYAAVPGTERSSFGASHHRLPADYFRTRGNSGRLRLAPGKAWAGRREVLDRHGFYDRFVVGAGDRLMLNAMFGAVEEAAQAYLLNPAQLAHYGQWARALFRDCDGSVGAVAGRLRHLWHGDVVDRRYEERHEAFSRFGIDPAVDLAEAPGGMLTWASDRPEMHAWVRGYFERRNEDAAPGTPARRASG